MESQPFTNGDRDGRGRFAPGNPGGPGNPRSGLARQLRWRLEDALHKVCSPDRMVAAIDAALKSAEAGDVAALKLLMERIAGPPISSELIERLERLEDSLNENNRHENRN